MGIVWFECFLLFFSLYFFISSINGDCVVSLTFLNPPTISIPTYEITDNWVYTLIGNSFTSTSTSGQSIFLDTSAIPSNLVQTGCANNFQLDFLETRSNCNGNLCAKNGNNQLLYAAGDMDESGFCTTCFDNTNCNVPMTTLSCEVVTNANAQSTGLAYNSGVSFLVTNKGTVPLKIQNWSPYVKATNDARTISVWTQAGSKSFTNFLANWQKLGTSDPFNTASNGFVSLSGIPPLEIQPGASFGILLVGSYFNLIYTDGDPASFSYSGQDISVVSGITTNSVESFVESFGPVSGNPVRSMYGKSTNCLYASAE